MVDTIIAAGILAGFFASLSLALHYAAKARRLKRRLAELYSLRAQVERLTAELEKAQRNDMPKDPVTGRFIPRS